ncbi:phosphatidate cytidylyltransferase [Candidatus Pelagibacter communis]|uniref:phosphatidate cytidylyltransferase n=1 Tax=Candidatus Pelagibacter TaxID=198251 RepID=UPI003EDF76D2
MTNELKKRILSSIIILPMILYIILKGSYLFLTLIIILYIVSLLEWSKLVKSYLIKSLGYFFLSVVFYFTYKLRLLEENEIPYNFLFVLFISIFSDLGGFIFGKILKGPKLTKISPNKTISGVIGAYILTLSFIYVAFMILVIEFNTITLLLVLLLSSISQVGDLVISYFKRISNVKDTGRLIPGHGGLLDRIDGLLFSLPTFYLIKLFY